MTRSTHNRRRPRSKLLALLALLVLVVSYPLLAQVTKPARVVVLYPDIPQPYLRIFDEMITGINRSHEGEVISYVLRPDATSSELTLWLQKNKVNDVIALGAQAMKIATGLPEKYRRVIGAVVRVPKERQPNFTVVSMSPDPELMFKRLLELVPGTDEITVIYSELDHWQQIVRAREAATKYNIKLNAIAENTNPETGANAYHELIKNDFAGTDAVWLLQGDRALSERIVLYNLLKASWNHNVILFSSNPSYVTKGALFALYPDNEALGMDLVTKLKTMRNGGKDSISHITSVLIAVNVRTAEHLELDISRAEERKFDIIFPQRQ